MSNETLNTILHMSVDMSLTVSKQSKGKHTMTTTTTHTTQATGTVISLNPSIDLLVDELGQLQDQAAALKLQIDSLKDTIKQQGAGRYLGSRWQSLVVDVAESKKTDWKAVAAHFNPSHQLITAHSTTVEATTKITTTIQKGKA